MMLKFLKSRRGLRSRGASWNRLNRSCAAMAAAASPLVTAASIWFSASYRSAISSAGSSSVKDFSRKLSMLARKRSGMNSRHSTVFISPSGYSRDATAKMLVLMTLSSSWRTRLWYSSTAFWAFSSR